MSAALEVADVFRDGQSRFVAQYGHTLRPEQRQAYGPRSSVAGPRNWADMCNAATTCGHQRIQYNSCRNRHCPKCQAPARARWLQAREAELLPVPYFHVVFTLAGRRSARWPCRTNASSTTCSSGPPPRRSLEVAANPKHLGARDRLLDGAAHLGPEPDAPSARALRRARRRTVPGRHTLDRARQREDFFLPVRVLSRVFRGKFIDLPETGLRHGQLAFHGSLAAAWPIRPPSSNSWITPSDTIGSSTPSGPSAARRVLKYLARYTHRVAISNRAAASTRATARSAFAGRITRDGQQSKVHDRSDARSSSAASCCTRFPSGFVRIRYYGFLANRHRERATGALPPLVGRDVGTGGSHE